MKHIISGTDRLGSKTFAVAKVVQSLYQEIQGEKVEIIDLKSLPMAQLKQGGYDGNLPPIWREAVDKVDHSDGLIVVVPEYNGSMPGALKYFIDHWSYPRSFEFRPVCLIGLGGRFGGLRPVEHLQQVFGYRNAFIYPERVFIMNAGKSVEEGKIHDQMVANLLRQQVTGFSKFIEALTASGLHANRRPAR